MEEETIDTISPPEDGKRKYLLLWILIGVIIVIIISVFTYYLINDNGTPEPSPEKGILKITSDNLILAENPRLINIPYNSKVKLNVELHENGKAISQNISDVEFRMIHPPGDQDPESIISIDSEGYAHYNNAGYVFVTASLKKKGDPRLARISGEEVIIAGGEVYGNPETDNVIAIFPPEFKPEESEYSFGDMAKNYPDFIRIWNLAYDIESELFNGFIPDKGNKQILALLDIPDHCGGNNNPLETAPCCYMNCGDGTPQYRVVINEMGHNFGQERSIMKLVHANGSRLGDNGFYSTFLVVLHVCNEFAHNSEKYNFGEFEFNYFNDFLEGDILENERTLSNFEKFINEERINGLFDQDWVDEETERVNRVDKISVFASFFIVPAANPDDFGNKYNWGIYERFLSLFSDEDLPDFFDEDKVETYFAAAYNAAIGNDLRDKLKFWGFTIDDDYFNEIYPQLVQKLN